MREEAGQGLVEYALLLVLIAMAIILVLGYFGVSLSNFYEWIITSLPF